MCVDEELLGNGLQIASGCLDRLESLYRVNNYMYMYIGVQYLCSCKAIVLSNLLAGFNFSFVC